MTSRGAVPLAAGTVATSNYLPWVRVLAESFAAHHPGVRLAVLILDDPDPEQLRPGERFELVRPPDVGLDGDDYGWMRSIYDDFELSCAVKPWLLRFLLTRAEAALYLDGDMLVCDALDNIARLAAHHGVVLTPHVLEPVPDDGLIPSEANLLRLGQFNAGFVAVGRAGGQFLDWWASRLRRECVAWSELHPLRFVDQRWLDLAVNFFPVHLLRDRGANVAYWNVGSRHLEHGPGGYTVDGQPLRFIHFSGFDPARPDVLSRHAGTPPRVDAREVPALSDLCAHYAGRLADAGWSASGAGARRWALKGGIELTPAVRAALRAALVETERGGTVPVPALSDEDAILAWLRAPVTAAGTSRYLVALHTSHPDVQAAFPHVPGADEERYLAWSASAGIRLGLVPEAVGGGPAMLTLPGARRFVVLVRAGELHRDPKLLEGVCERFTASDDVAILVHAPGADPEAFAGELRPVLAAAGLEGPDAPDVLGLVLPAGPAALAPHIHALLTRGPIDPALADLPAVADATALRTLADASAPPLVASPSATQPV